MHPAEGITSDGYCLADPGHEYIIFLNSAAPFSLKLEGLADPLKGQWFQALTGKRQDAGTINSATSEMNPPAEWGSGPVALHLGISTAPVTRRSVFFGQFPALCTSQNSPPQPLFMIARVETKSALMRRSAIAGHLLRVETSGRALLPREACLWFPV